MTGNRGSILLVDDEEKILKALGRALRAAGHEVLETTSPREALRLLAERPFDVVMPQLSGLDLIRKYVASTPEGERPQILMMTAHATVESAIEAMKLGALDYLQKPFEIDELLVVVRRALEHQRLRTDYRYLVSERDESFDHYGIIARSTSMEEVIRRAELVAETKSTVLITGETGTGKELVARAIHDRSAQRDMPLIKVNCAAIPETLLESELFGHVRGAFTGATTTKKGKFALADGGTIFLDEIGTMTPALQSKLLRVLQEREFEPLGAERTDVLSQGPVITARAVSVIGAATPQTSGLPSLKLRQNIEWVERETIRRALDSASGVKKEAAELMGISQRALSYYLAKY